MHIVTANYLISAMKEQPTTGVTSLFFLSPFLMKNGHYAELRDWPFGYLGGGGVQAGFLFKKIFWFLICKKKINKMAQEGY